MTKFIDIEWKKKKLLKDVKVCESFLSRSIGLMFSRKAKKSLLLVSNKPSIENSSIHMLFVFYAIDVLWLDENKTVIDRRRAYPFQLLLRPRSKAKYVLETPAGKLKHNIMGEKLYFK